MTQHYLKQGGRNRGIRRDDKTRIPEELGPAELAQGSTPRRRSPRSQPTSVDQPSQRIIARKKIEQDVNILRPKTAVVKGTFGWTFVRIETNEGLQGLVI